jgi:D-glycero-D-manno-heptose 1,7-bisphosphate phosphatase
MAMEQILQTVKLGGTLIFLKDRLHAADTEHWLTINKSIPHALREISQLQLGVVATRKEDLFVLVKAQENLLPKLQAFPGQRIVLDMELAQWQTLQLQVENALQEGTKIKSFDKSFEASCLFLDRDDVIVKNVPYNKDPEKVELMPGIAELINQAHQNHYWVAMVSNQSGLGRGMIDWDQYQQVHQRMLKLLADKNAWLDECLWASYIDSSAEPEGSLYENLRKPKPGMFLQAQEKLKMNFKNSIMIGDSSSDLSAAHAVGIGKLFLLESEKVEKELAALKDCGFAYEVLPTLESGLSRNLFFTK